MSVSEEKKARERARRKRLRDRGLRPKRFWVPDTRRNGFAEEARSQSLKVAVMEVERECMAFIEAVEAECWPSDANASKGPEAPGKKK